MAIQDQYDAPVAFNPTGGVDGGGALESGAEFQVFLPTDVAFSTPLPVTDPVSGAAISPLRSSSIGVLPDFKVAGDPTEVVLKSGTFVTRLQSRYGIFVEAGWDAGLAAQAMDAATVAADARDAAIAAKEAAEAAGGNRRTWAQAFAAPALGDTPTISVGTALPAGTLTPPSGGDTDAAYRYNGGPSVTVIDANWVGPAAPQAGASYLLHPEFVTDRGNTEFWIKVESSSTTLGIRLVIDGRWHSLDLDRFAVASATTQYVHVTFPTGKARFIRVELLGIGKFGGVIVPAGQAVTRPQQPIRFALTFVWDSFGDGAGDPADTTSRLETAPNFLAHLLGADRFINVSIAGTGWDPDEANNFTQRFPFAAATHPHVMCIPASRNDDNANDVYTAALPGLAVLADVPLVYTFSSPLVSFAAVSAAVRDAAIANGRPYRDIQGSNTGLISDGIHPSFASHQAIAAAMYAQIDVNEVGQALASIRQDSVGITLEAAPTGYQEQGEDVVLTATLSPAVAGTVQFRSNGAVIGTATAVAGEATFTTDALALGAHSLTARFVPADSYSYKPSTSTAATVTILAEFLTDIILTNLLAEITVTAISGLADGAAVTSLTPPRGSRVEALLQATGSLQPVKVAADSHGHASIRFQADRLDAPDWATATAAGTPLTFYTVHRMVSLGSGRQDVFRGGATGTAVAYGHQSSTGAYLTATSALATPAGQPNGGDTGWQVTAVTFDSNFGTIHQNVIGSPVSVAVTTATATLDGIGLGQFGGGTTGYDARISAVYAYSGKHTAEQITAMMLYLSDLWDVPLDVA
ncbi:Ig-like domain-containing protein [Microbacterium allomyrinae]|uniref:Ig-like domain repeat protein n=1 Tax=Microbacterium allomyrinae TaxID=2830666 RepID=A0A9X1S1P2_9MICO|nr:Ig-like domain-containing protein [Microbacterium allomyrinae]MCC2031841.1 Ig-like domain repeat protein [Microbacterium allomyrinae]